MSMEIEVDGSIFTFPDGWELEKIDEWREQRKLNGRPFHSKGCDVVAISGTDMWLIEVKDYTFPGASVPDDLAETVGLKVFHSLAVLHSTARWGDGAHQEFATRALACTTARVCLAVELPDGGRKLLTVATPLSNLKSALKPVMKKLNVHRPVVSNSHLPGDVPWTVRRDPATRQRHADR